MLGGDEEKDPDAAKKEEERQEALRQAEEERKAKYAKMEAEREVMRQGIRDKVSNWPVRGGALRAAPHQRQQSPSFANRSPFTPNSGIKILGTGLLCDYRYSNLAGASF